MQGAVISWTMFHVLGIQPQLGRDFREEEDRVGAEKVILIGDRLWHDKFGASRDVLGKPITVNGVPYTVIGVMPRDFEFPGTAQAWTTMRQDPTNNRGNHSWQVMGLSGSGSKDVVVSDAFIPEYRTVIAEKLQNGWYAEQFQPRHGTRRRSSASQSESHGRPPGAKMSSRSGRSNCASSARGTS